MNISVVYLVNRLLYVLLSFLRHWYADSFLFIMHHLVNILESLDRGLALKITIRNFFKPLYQDYTFIGYIFGFFFRTIRISIALIAYSALLIVALYLYLLWAFIPLYIFYAGFA